MNLLKRAKKPIIGSELAEKFDVSRQVIVQDIALLRAAGEEVIATSQGYLLPGEKENKYYRTTIACKHNDHQVEDELMIIVNHGARIIDVMVEHPIYGELRGMLMIQAAEDVKQFMKKYREEGATLLSSLTDGVHLHTIESLNKEVVDRLKMALREKGYLLEN